MSEINLLPIEIGGQGNIGKISRALNKVGLVIGIILLILGSLIGGYMLLLTKNISDSNARQSELVAIIESKETVEQQFVLVRDRVDKIKPVIAKASASDTADIFQSIANSIPDGIVINQAEIKAGAMEVTFQTTRSSDLIGLFNTLASNDLFNSVTLKNFNFNPTIGYTASIEMLTN